MLSTYVPHERLFSLRKLFTACLSKFCHANLHAVQRFVRLLAYAGKLFARPALGVL